MIEKNTEISDEPIRDPEDSLRSVMSSLGGIVSAQIQSMEEEFPDPHRDPDDFDDAHPQIIRGCD